MGVVPTTIIPPRTTRPFIVRPVLQRLVASIDRASLVTVCAAAGSGKTTAMLYWAEELQKAERPLLWLAARAGISNLSTFQNALIAAGRSEEHTSELQSLMRNSYAVFCLNKKKTNTTSKNRQNEY